MPLDSKIIHEAQAAYRQWNEAELRDRLHAVNKPSTQETWQQYVALVEFCWKLAPEQSDWQQAQKQDTLLKQIDGVIVDFLLTLPGAAGVSPPARTGRVASLKARSAATPASRSPSL